MSKKVHIERRLAAVVVADLVRNDQPIGQDIEAAGKWRMLRENLIAPKIAEHSGRLVRTVGDGLLIEFRSTEGGSVY